MPKITPTGVVPVTQSEYFDKLTSLYLSIDPDWVLDSNSPDGQFLILVSRMMWELDQEAIGVRASTDPRQANGSQVDDLAALFDVYREDESQSKITFDLIGTAGVAVSKGSQIKNAQTGDVWSLDNDAVIPGEGNFTSLEYGNITDAGGFVPATLINGWESVENPKNYQIGRDEQTDQELELERENSVAIASQSLPDSIKSAIYGVDGVIDCDVIVNEESIEVNGQDPNSVHCIVSGGDEVQICQAINSKISTGCKSVGSIEHIITTEIDIYGMPRRFDRPVFVNVWVRYTIQGLDRLNPYDVSLIPQYVEQYSKGQVDLPYNSNDSGFGLGKSPSTDLMAIPLNWAIGSYLSNDNKVYTDKIEISKDGIDWESKILPIERLEQALFSAERVSVVAATPEEA